MSNSEWEALPGFEGLIVVGAEVINGTGEVSLRLQSEPVPGLDPDTILYVMSPSQALGFARLLSRQAHEALRAKWNEDNLNVG